tara:strand:- start:3076 stop:3288 length:213 start_codon:yes stop_codon:yes gene_type:complete
MTSQTNKRRVRPDRAIALMGGSALLVYGLLSLTPWPQLSELFAIPATVAMVLLIWWPHITANEEKTDGQT